MASTPLGHTYTPATPDAAGTVALEIRHLDSDSFTRSVDRAALAWVRRQGFRNYPGHDWAVTGGQYAARELEPGGAGSNGRPWCVSVVTFRVERVTR
jgi:hypothetical protein